MRKAIQLMVLGLAMSAMIATSSFAEFVYVTKSGTKFHHAQSRYSEYDQVEKITKEEAVERGYEPSKSYLKMEKRLESEEVKASKKSKK